MYVPVAEVGGPRVLALSLADGTTRWDTVLTNQSGADVFGSVERLVVTGVVEAIQLCRSNKCLKRRVSYCHRKL